MRTKLYALIAVVGLLGMAVGPGVAAAASDDGGNETTDDSLSVGVEQTDGVVVSVTQNGTGVENASVDVAVDGNGSYAGTGSYVTDANGTVDLAPPGENVTVDVTASANNETASTTASLTVENESAPAAFGPRMSLFVQWLVEDDSTDVGQQVSEFAREHNPGNAPDHAGPSDDTGSADESDGGNGPPEHAGNGGDAGNGDDKGNGNGNGGQPDHAGGPDRGGDETDAE